MVFSTAEKGARDTASISGCERRDACRRESASGDGAAACCKAGSLQGCNTLGNQQALAGDWVKAAGSYLQVCRAGVREGCENLASAQENSAEVDARAQLQQLCEADRSGRHVACDVVATRNWTLMELGRALQALAKSPVRRPFSSVAGIYLD